LSYYVRPIALPNKEPVSLAEAKSFCKVPPSVTEDDSLLTGLITAGRVHAEGITGRCLAQRQYVLVLDGFHRHHYNYAGFWPVAEMFFSDRLHLRNEIRIPYPPLKSVDSIRYVAADGSTVTLEPDTDFIVDRIAEPGRIFPPHGQHWPSALHVANAIEITFTAGYDPDPAAAPDEHDITGATNQQPDSIIVLAVPEAIRTAILILTHHWYVNREPVAAGSVGTVPNHVNELLALSSINDFCPSGTSR
jgi:uncharacterized phiE125 gp8 family phage protein